MIAVTVPDFYRVGLSISQELPLLSRNLLGLVESQVCPLDIRAIVHSPLTQEHIPKLSEAQDTLRQVYDILATVGTMQC